MSAMVSQATQATRTYVHPGANRGANARRDGTGRTKTGAALWTVQGLLALLFLFAGGMKLAMPLDVMAEMMPLSPIFMKFIGLCECLGAVGLVLPALLRIRPGLTPLAAAGLVIIMIGATTLTAATMGIAPALFPLVVGCLATGVAYGRVRLAPIAALA